jgi:hypothetical protein
LRGQYPLYDRVTNLLRRIVATNPKPVRPIYRFAKLGEAPLSLFAEVAKLNQLAPQLAGNYRSVHIVFGLGGFRVFDRGTGRADSRPRLWNLSIGSYMPGLGGRREWLSRPKTAVRKDF